MADEIPDNIDLNWIGRTLLNMQREMRAGFAELHKMRAEDRSLLEDVAREIGIEQTSKRLRREHFEKQTDERLARIEAKLFPSAE